MSWKVLITGGLGFIGSNVAIRLVREGADVTIVDNLLDGHGGNRVNITELRGQVDVRIGDIRDTDLLRDVVRGKDLLINLAAQTSHMGSMRDPYTDIDINTRGQIGILEACRNENPSIKIVSTSTRQLYGRPDYLPVDERHPVRPVDVNGINKAAGENYFLLYNDVYGIRCCILRLTNTYGPRVRIKDASQLFLGLWIRSIVEGRTFEVWGGDQIRDLVFVDDVVDAIVLAAKNDASNGQVYNVGTEDGISLRELAEMLIQVNGAGRYEVKEFPSERKDIDIGDYCTDSRKIQSALGWAPKIALQKGLERTLSYYREHLSSYI